MSLDLSNELGLLQPELHHKAIDVSGDFIALHGVQWLLNDVINLNENLKKTARRHCSSLIVFLVAVCLIVHTCTCIGLQTLFYMYTVNFDVLIAIWMNH